MKLFKPSHITEDDPDTLDDLYMQARISHLPESLQRIAVNHQLDQWEAEPSIVERTTQELQRNSLRQ